MHLIRPYGLMHFEVQYTVNILCKSCRENKSSQPIKFVIADIWSQSTKWWTYNIQRYVVIFNIHVAFSPKFAVFHICNNLLLLCWSLFCHFTGHSPLRYCTKFLLKIRPCNLFCNKTVGYFTWWKLNCFFFYQWQKIFLDIYYSTFLGSVFISDAIWR